MNELKLPQIIGVTGVARAGKDTFFKIAHSILKEQDKKSMRMAFADAVKQDCHQLLVKKSGISAFTDDNTQKDLIRPLLVAYGTDLMRRLDENYWINRLKMSVELSRHMNAVSFVTDVRYENEIDWIQKEEQGLVVHLHRAGCKAPNKEERHNDPILKKRADIRVSWPSVGSEWETQKEKLRRKVIFALNKLQTLHLESEACLKS
jgi:hypothetical protein